MPFHPEELSTATWRDLAKSLKKGAPGSLGHPITLPQAQALLANTLGYPHWSALIRNAHGSASPEEQLEKFTQDLERQFGSLAAKEGWSFYVDGDVRNIFTAEELSAVDGLLSFWLILAFAGKAMPRGVRLHLDPQSLAGLSMLPVSLPQQEWDDLKKAVIQAAQALGKDPASRDLSTQLQPVVLKYSQAHGYGD